MMLIIPLPTVLLDMFMTLNLTVSLVIILMTLYNARATDFLSFPTVLLVTTVFGLALNISSTRLILAQGQKFDGKLIKAFSSFVVGAGGNEGLVIGFIIFIIIIAVQVLVITKGSTRGAEVAARFTLDALPGKQMSIDAEYSSGAISEEEAGRRKRLLQQEVDFYGQMDAAAKFVSGNVKVGILITAVNIIGGLIVGVTLHNEGWQGALGTYVSFAIGDGLVSQFPALLVSAATGIIVTRGSSNSSFADDFAQELSREHMIYWITAFFLFIVALLPGFPAHVFIPLSILSGVLATIIRRSTGRTHGETAKTAKSQAAEPSAEISPVVPLDPLSLELGYGLVSLLEKDQGVEFLGKIKRIRKEVALETGLVVPQVHIIDNMMLEPTEYRFKMKGSELGKGSLRTSMYLAINPGTVREEVPGEKTIEPTFGLPALWIKEDMKEKADREGYTVVDPPSIIVTHLMEIIKKHAAEILGRQELQLILDTLKKTYPAVVEEVAKSPIGLGGIQKILQNLLRERVSIRNMVEILETIADYGAVTKDVSFITEKTRQVLARQICSQYVDEEKKLRVFTIPRKLEMAIIDSCRYVSGGIIAGLKPETQSRWISALRAAERKLQDAGHAAFVLLCSETGRPVVRASVARDFPHMAVLSALEIVSDIKVEFIGEIKLEG
ncbi:MAG: flagellar biosynthesis protein FlhA [Spirochaetaceae bacterium]|nr:flagellar biosynthesis protein FlhA [Spirochaetaceae bacterium]